MNQEKKSNGLWKNNTRYTEHKMLAPSFSSANETKYTTEAIRYRKDAFKTLGKVELQNPVSYAPDVLKHLEVSGSVVYDVRIQAQL